MQDPNEAQEAFDLLRALLTGEGVPDPIHAILDGRLPESDSEGESEDLEDYFSPTLRYNRDDLYDYMGFVFLSRKMHSWRLMEAREVENVEHHHPDKDVVQCWYVKGHVQHYLLDTEHATMSIRREFPLADKILEVCGGRVVAAGGAIVRAIYNRFNARQCDLDFFFVGADPSLPNERHIQDVQELLAKVEKVFLDWCSQFPAPDDHDGNPYYHKVVTDRYTTFVVHEDVDLDYEQYQFITSRVYEDPLHVVGGFDIPACQCYYDGKDVFVTEAAAFSLANGVVVLDPGCRSTSYEKRLVKYLRVVPRLAFPFATSGAVLKAKRKVLLGEDPNKPIEMVSGLRCHFRSDWEGNVTGYLSTRKCVEDYISSESDYGSDAQPANCSSYWQRLRQNNTIAAIRGKFENVGFLPGHTSVNTECAYFIFNKFRLVQVFGLEKGLEMFALAVERDEIKVSPKDLGRVIGESSKEFNNELAKLAAKPMQEAFEYAKNRDPYKLLFYGPRDNPGRQYTASFNPVEDEPIGEYYKLPFQKRSIGISHEVYSILRNLLHRNKNLTNYLCKFVARNMMQAFRDKWLSPRPTKPKSPRPTRPESPRMMCTTHIRLE